MPLTVRIRSKQGSLILFDTDSGAGQYDTANGQFYDAQGLNRYPNVVTANQILKGLIRAMHPTGDTPTNLKLPLCPQCHDTKHVKQYTGHVGLVFACLQCHIYWAMGIGIRELSQGSEQFIRDLI